jgi:hypothetical protein
MSSGRWILSESDLFGSYVEALNALGTVENRQRDALRKAVEGATAIKERAKAQMAEQQRMYDQAGKDANDAERLLADLRSMLGLAQAVTAAATPQAGTPPQLVQIRGEVLHVADWATETRSTAESLLRTRERLVKAAELVEPNPPPAPAQVAKAASPRRPRVEVIAAIALLVAIVIVVVALIAH